MALIDFYIRNQKLSKNGPAIVADSIKYVDCSFTFKTDDWSGLDKWAIFKKGDETYRADLVNDAIPKETGLSIGEGTWYVSVFGAGTDGTRITTDSVTVEVKKSSIDGGEPLPVIEQTEAEQIAAKAQSALNIANFIKEAAENGEFDGKDGKNGEDGFSPTVEISTATSMSRVAITDKNGTKTFTVRNGTNGRPGADGAPGYTPIRGTDYWTDEDKREIIEEASKEIEAGAKGEDGFSPTVEVTETENGHNVKITDLNGEKTFVVTNGAKGDKGESGAKGEKGDKGETGAKGDKGDTGAQGPQGVQGEQGPAGADGAKGDKGDTGAKGDKGETGATGERGLGILGITTAPSSYTTATGGFTPKYRIALSTVLSQAQVDKVLVGDTIKYSYYTYPVGYVDASYVYLGTRVSIRGSTGAAGTAGTSVSSVEQTTTSSADGGSNVMTVTLSDGTTSTFTVKNGSKGSDGADGKDAENAIDEYVRTEAERVAKVVQSRQNENTISFFACSDFHYSQIQSHAAQQLVALTHMGQGMKLIREKVHIDFAAMLGDMIWDVGETNETGLEEIRFVNECLAEGFGSLPQFRSRGNHENGYESGADFSKSQIFANIGIFNNGAVFDSANKVAGYCYRDFEEAKLRVINLNSSEEGGCLFSSAQVSWLAKALDLSAKGSGWRSIILSHHPIDWGKSGGTDPTNTIKGASGVICTIHGHIHNFLVDTLTGTTLKRIAIPNAGYTRENQYGTSYNINWKDTTTYSKTPGTAEDTSFCVITIDFGAKKIYADHYGAGCDRVITYDEAVLESYSVTNNLTKVSNSSNITAVDEGGSYSATLTAYEGYELDTVTVTMGGTNITSTAYSGGKITIASVTGDIVITAIAKEAEAAPSYTNLVPTSLDPTTWGVYNASGTPGYKDGYYASGANEGSDAACVLTGLIPYANSETTPIYIKGADITTASHCRIIGFNTAGQAAFQSAAGSSLTTYFTVETLGTSYYRITPTSSWTGKSGYSDYLRFSLIGKGANLIITKNQPIE